MGKFSDVLLTVDYDRTLTAPDSTIPQRNLDAIRYFMEEGGSFTVNTGRSLPMCHPMMELVPVNAPLLLYNGSAAYDLEKREFTFLHKIDLDWREMVRHCMEIFPDMVVEIQGVDAHYLFREDRAWERFTEANLCAWDYVDVDGPREMDPFIKFTVYGQVTQPNVAHLFEGTPEQVAQIERAQEILTREYGDKTVVFRAGLRILDVHCRGVSKGRSARELQQQLGKKILVCVGDGENDVTMLRAADYAWCPGDSVVRDRFATVCDCAEGSVADVIYKKIPEILK